MNYEFWYNWDYAVKCNPKLMHLGTTGGFGPIRRDMIEAVAAGNRGRAEECFWQLVYQTEWEHQCDLKFDMPLWLEEQEAWFRRVLINERFNDQWFDIRHFMRSKASTDNVSRHEVNARLLAQKARMRMRDTPMDLHPDPMVIPTMATFKDWGGVTTYVQDLRQFIEFVHDDEDMDPMDPAAIY